MIPIGVILIAVGAFCLFAGFSEKGGPRDGEYRVVKHKTQKTYTVQRYRAYLHWCDWSEQPTLEKAQEMKTFLEEESVKVISSEEPKNGQKHSIE